MKVAFAVPLMLVLCACGNAQQKADDLYRTINVRTTYSYTAGRQDTHPLSYIEVDSSVAVEVLYLALSPGNRVFDFVLDNRGSALTKVYASNSPTVRGQRVGKEPVRIRVPMKLIRQISQGETEDNFDTSYLTIVKGSNPGQIVTCKVIASRDPSAGGMIASCRPQFDL